jgi:hypothetical protein
MDSVATLGVDRSFVFAEGGIIRRGKIALMDPVDLSFLTAPLDDEPETEEERATVERALAEPGPGTSHEEVLREFGLPHVEPRPSGSGGQSD